MQNLAVSALAGNYFGAILGIYYSAEGIVEMRYSNLVTVNRTKKVHQPYLPTMQKKKKKKKKKKTGCALIATHANKSGSTLFASHANKSGSTLFDTQAYKSGLRCLPPL